MATGKNIETRGHIVGFREEISKAAALSENNFFTWFDSAKDKEAAFIRGSWDFTVHIALPALQFLSHPEEKTALEIGYGGGRILTAAARHFRSVVGVDIHEHSEKVQAELNKRGINNCILRKTDGANIPVEDNSIDFIYSFIVFQHLEKIEIFKSYLCESYRVLKPGGIAVFYFGRKAIFSENKKIKILYMLDRISESIVMMNSFKELPAQVNCTNLVVSMSYAKSFARKIGFRVLSELVSRKKVPDGIQLYGGQNGLVVKK